jgi:hypothetical protein
MMERIAAKWLPNKVVAAFDPQKDGFAGELPLFKGKDVVANKPALFLCRNYSCQAPLTTLKALDRELNLL